MKSNELAVAGLLFFLLAAAPAAAVALTADQEQPIYLEADSLDVDENKDEAVYRGNVVLTQGSMKIVADTLIIYGVANNTDKIVAKGKPVKFRQRPENADQDVRGEALQMEYYTDSEKLLLLGSGKIWQEEKVFTNDWIEYDRNNARLKAGGKNAKDRVRMTIPPKKKKN